MHLNTLAISLLVMVAVTGAIFTDSDRTFAQCAKTPFAVTDGIPAGDPSIISEAPTDGEFRTYTIPAFCVREGEPGGRCEQEFLTETQQWINGTRQVDVNNQCSCFRYFYERLNKGAKDTDRRVTVRFFIDTRNVSASTDKDQRENVARSILAKDPEQPFNVSSIYWVMNDCPEARCPIEFNFRKLGDSDRCGFASRDQLYDIDDDDDIVSNTQCNQIQLQMTSRRPLLDRTYIFAVRGTPGTQFIMRYEKTGDEPFEEGEKGGDPFPFATSVAVNETSGLCTYSGTTISAVNNVSILNSLATINGTEGGA